MIHIDSLGMRFGEKVLFEGVSLGLKDGCRYGITGANGSGKSTILKILSGEMTAQDGEVRLPGSIKVGFLKQNHFAYEEVLILDAVLMGRPLLWDSLREKAELLESADINDSETGMRLAELECQIGELDGYNAQSQAAIILEGLGLESACHLETMSTLSGGYKLRVLLAQCLFSNPGLLLLDEPTNHLDIVSISWLEGYLTKYKGTVMVVSHDHHFLNAVATHILDIDYETVRLYHGNYDASLCAKQLISTQNEQIIASQEKKKDELEAFYKRFRAQATKARQAMSRKKQLDKMDDIVIKRSSRIAPRFRFLQKRPSGKEVLELKGVCKAYDGKSVIEDLNLSVRRGEKVAVIGPNGAGKTTLMRLITGEVSVDSGEVKKGHEVSPGYFAQNHKEQIPSGTTVYDWLLNYSNAESTTVIRSILGAMLFSGDDAKKRSESLSGGEAARLIFSRLILAQNNLLLLDEPTNHLDIESIEALAEAVIAYPGTVVFVSHDRFFVEAVATSVMEITPRSYEYFNGPYAEFIAKRQVDHLSRSDVQTLGKKHGKKVKSKGKKDKEERSGLVDERTRRKKLDALAAKAAKREEAIKSLEDSIDKLNAHLGTGDLYKRGREDDLERTLQELEQMECALGERMAQWESLLVRTQELQGV